jgi:hypothetical protein
MSVPISSYFIPDYPTPYRPRSGISPAPVIRQPNPYISKMSKIPSPSLAGNAGVAAQTASAQRPLVNPNIQVNYDSDPVLQRIRALGQMNISNARSEAAAARRQALIDAGMPDVAEAQGADPETLDAVRGNQFSVAQDLARQEEEQRQAMQEAFNSNNLWFSGRHAQGIEDLGREGLRGRHDLSRLLGGTLNDITGALAAAEQAEIQREQEALERIAAQEREEAMMRALMEALSAGSAMPISPYDPSLPETMDNLPERDMGGPSGLVPGGFVPIDPLTGLPIY